MLVEEQQWGEAPLLGKLSMARMEWPWPLRVWMELPGLGTGQGHP